MYLSDTKFFYLSSIEDMFSDMEILFEKWFKNVLKLKSKNFLVDPFLVNVPILCFRKTLGKPLVRNVWNVLTEAEQNL